MESKVIDFVITWVDGNDPVLTAKRQKYLNQSVSQEAINQTRFADNGEVYFAIASILKYVPWAGTIYLVTDQQKPQWLDEFSHQGLCTEDKIRIIDHQQIFRGYERFLPTFNSISIESLLWNIPNISRWFVYLNDDFFFNADTKIEDFFKDNKIILYGIWKTTLIDNFKYFVRNWFAQRKNKVLKPKHTYSQVMSANILGMKRYLNFQHLPHFLDKDILEEYFKKNADIVEKQISFKFRNIAQFAIVGLANHLAVQQGKAIVSKFAKIAYLKPGGDIEKLIADLNNGSVKYGCIQSLDMMTTLEQARIGYALLKKFQGYLPNSLIQQFQARG